MIEMDVSMGAVVMANLPGLDDNAVDFFKGLLTGLAGGRR